jgi:hypothetical protein
MANPPDKQQQPEQEKPREASEGSERKQTNPREAHEGMPGYGQAPEEVRREKLPEQDWK